MAQLKTRPGEGSVRDFLAAITDPQRRRDCQTIARIMQKATGARPRLWGDSIVGFGGYHYKYASGREGDWFLTGFSPRRRELSLYLTSGLDGFGKLLARLGRHKIGKGCLYLKCLEDIRLPVLEELIRACVQHLRGGR
jgi:hypothetical protein